MADREDHWGGGTVTLLVKHNHRARRASSHLLIDDVIVLLHYTFGISRVSGQRSDVECDVVGLMYL